MRHRTACGVIPIHILPDGSIRFLLVQGYGRYWGFPKGGMEDGENKKETAERELSEETQLQCDYYIENTLFMEQYIIPKKKGNDIMKKVFYFLGIISDTDVILQKTELRNYGWFSLEEAQSKLVKNRAIILEKVHTKIRDYLKENV